MVSTTQEQILAVIADVLEEQPDMRFGQLVASLALFAKGPVKSATWDVEDDEILNAAKRHLENLQQCKVAKAEVQKIASATRQKVAV